MNSIAIELSTKASQQTIPLDVTWEITKQCNIHCKPCYIVNKKHHELTRDEGFRLLEDLAEARTMYITFTGGEPFLRKDDLRRWAFYAQKLGMTVSIFTNGTLVTDEDIVWLKELSPFAVHVSLFAVDEDIHDSITGNKGSFNKTMHVIQALSKDELPIIIKMLLFKENFNERNKLIKYAQKLGVAWSIDPVVTPLETGELSNAHLRLSQNQIEQLFSDTAKYVIPRFEPNKPGEFQCGAGINLTAISSNGDVYPCLMYPKSAGNVREEKFSSIWQNSLLIKNIRSLNLKDIEQCRDCDDLSYCTRCPGLALLEDKNEFGASTSSCMLAQITKKFVNLSSEIPE